jgi:hypothetical protein
VFPPLFEKALLHNMESMDLVETSFLLPQTTQPPLTDIVPSLKRRSSHEDSEDDSDEVVTVSNKIKRMKLPTSTLPVIEQNMSEAVSESNNPFIIKVKTLQRQDHGRSADSGALQFGVRSHTALGISTQRRKGIVHSL